MLDERVAPRLHATRGMSKLDTLSDEVLARVTGGMHLDPTEMDPIDDRRHETRKQARWRMRHAPPLPPTQRVGERHPNDLPHQAGLDDIRRHRRYSRHV